MQHKYAIFKPSIMPFTSFLQFNDHFSRLASYSKGFFVQKQTFSQFYIQIKHSIICTLNAFPTNLAKLVKKFVLIVSFLLFPFLSLLSTFLSLLSTFSSAVVLISSGSFGSFLSQWSFGIPCFKCFLLFFINGINPG